jgi:hypothetical protein
LNAQDLFFILAPAQEKPRENTMTPKIQPYRLAPPRVTRLQVDVTSTAWIPRGAMQLDEWVNHGKRLGAVGRACGWWIGDWLNFGNAAYGEKYSRAARVSGYDVQTLRNMAYVASRYEISRRREIVSWSHHAELAAMPPDLQDPWLDRIEADGLTVKDLRTELRRVRKVGEGHRRESAVGAKAETPAEGQHTCPRCGHTYGPLD